MSSACLHYIHDDGTSHIKSNESMPHKHRLATGKYKGKEAQRERELLRVRRGSLS
jgi:hypothetical protein